MNKPSNKKNMTAVMGAAVATTLSAPLMVNAAENPFAMQDLGSGYMQVAEQKEMTCGEGKCGANMKKPEPAAEKKAMEGKCAANMSGASTAAPAAAPAAAPKQGEGACGAMMKGNEGSCGGMKGGQGVCGAMMKDGAGAIPPAATPAPAPAEPAK